MEPHFLFNESLKWYDIISLVATLFATVVTIGYWVKPRLKFCIFKANNKWKVNLINCNWLRSSVKDIYCEIAISEYENFKIVKTLELQKDSTVFIRTCHDNYIFSTKNTILKILSENIENETGTNKEEITKDVINRKRKDYQFIRVRILAPNFIGVKKAYEKKIKITEVIENECDPCQGIKATK